MSLFNGKKAKHDVEIEHLKDSVDRLCTSVDNLGSRVQRLERIYYMGALLMAGLVAAAPYWENILDFFQG
jgi:hypothetical protein